MSALLLVLAMVVTTQGTSRANDDNGSDASKIQKGFEIAPVPLNTDGKNPALVASAATSSTRKRTAPAVTALRRMRLAAIRTWASRRW